MFYLTINDPLPVLPGNDQDLDHENIVICLTKCAKWMTLSVLETSIPMQRNHDILASDISAYNWCLGW